MRKIILPIALTAIMLAGLHCVPKQKLQETPPGQTGAQNPNPPLPPYPHEIMNDTVPWQPVVMILTTEGEIRVKLYNETPLHRDNFLKLVSEHFYDSLLFHRVIENFVIQGGDPNSKKAKPGELLGDGDAGYWIPAEFNPKLFHKRGALAAARESDLINPKQESSGCQFYIVQGKRFSDSLLQVQARRITKARLYNQTVNKAENKWILEKYRQFADQKQEDSMKVYSVMIDKQVEQQLPMAPLYQFTPEQKQAYTSEGGTPHLDGSYTVFGEVIQGMDVVDKIAAMKRDKNDRPQKDVRILKMIVLKKI